MADPDTRERLSWTTSLTTVGVAIPANDEEKIIHGKAFVDAQAQQPNLESWQRLVATMALALHRRQNGKFTKNLPQGLETSAICVNALGHFFLDQQWFKDRGFHQPFAELMTAIMDLAQGNNPELFKPIVQRPRRRPLPSPMEDIVKGKAAKSLHLFIAAGERPDDAASKIVRALKAARVRGASRWTKETIKNWRARHMEGKNADGVTELSLTHFSFTPSGTTDAESAEAIMRELRGSPVLKEVSRQIPD